MPGERSFCERVRQVRHDRWRRRAAATSCHDRPARDRLPVLAVLAVTEIRPSLHPSLLHHRSRNLNGSNGGDGSRNGPHLRNVEQGQHGQPVAGRGVEVRRRGGAPAFAQKVSTPGAADKMAEPLASAGWSQHGTVGGAWPRLSHRLPLSRPSVRPIDRSPRGQHCARVKPSQPARSVGRWAMSGSGI